MKFKINKNYLILGGGLIFLLIVGISIYYMKPKAKSTEKYDMGVDLQTAGQNYPAPTKAQMGRHPAVMQAPNQGIDMGQMESGFNMPYGSDMTQGMGDMLDIQSGGSQYGHEFDRISAPQAMQGRSDYTRGTGQMPQRDTRTQMERQYSGENVSQKFSPNPATNSLGVGQGLGNGGGGNPLTASYEYL